MNGKTVQSFRSITGKLLFCLILISGLILPYVSTTSASDDFISYSVSSGAYHSLGLKVDGTVWAWGYNTNGQLGDGTKTNRTIPVKVVGLTEVQAVAGGTAHSIALKEDGTVWAWGMNFYGGLGDGTIVDRIVPGQVKNLTNVKAIATFGHHNLALKEDGTVWSWGLNNYGQLGDGTETDRTIPVQVVGLTDIIAIATGGAHSLALKSDGTVWSWGNNITGQLGDGTNTKSSVPVQVQNLTGIQMLDGGDGHSIALKEDGTVWSWGWNSFGQLGIGTTNNHSVPVQVQNLIDVKAISAGKNHSLAIREDGTVWSWGNNTEGELGDGSVETRRHIPVQVRHLSNVQSIATGEYHSLAVTNNGEFWSWGRNNEGQLGDGSSTDRYVPVPVLNIISSNANLSNITLSTGSLDPSFFPNIFKYNAGTVPTAINTITVTPTAQHSLATIQVRINDGEFQPVPSGSPSPLLDLKIGLNEIQIETIAENKSTRQTYSIQIIRLASPEIAVSLSDIQLGGGAVLDEPFDANTLNYTAHVPYHTEYITVRPVAFDTGAKITVSMNDGAALLVSSGVYSPSLPLNVGENRLNILVQSPDLLQQKTYSLTIKRAFSNTAELSNLQVSPGNLDTIFDAKNTIYKVENIGNESSVTIKATLADANATLLINGQAALNGQPFTVPLQHGVNLISIEVTAADGMNQKTYVLSVNGDLSNANLDSLLVNSGVFTLEPVFQKDHFHYNMEVSNDTDVVSIQANAEDEHAFVLVNKKILPRNDIEQVSLQVGDNVITIVVIAQNGSTKTYTLTIKRAASNHAALSGLSLHAGADELLFTPMFDTAQVSYTANVANHIAQVRVKATSLHPQAKLEARVRYSPDGGTYESLMPGEQSQPFALQVGTNFIDIRVLAEDGTTEQVYTITVIRSQSSNADLLNVHLSDGIKLNETFQSSRTEYTAHVPFSIASLNVTPVAVDSSASITLTANGGLSQAIKSGQASSPIPLEVGNNTITLEAESEDQSNKIKYTFIVTRTPNSDADLVALFVEPGNLRPAFIPQRTVYTVEDIGSTDILMVTAILSDSQEASLKIANENATHSVTKAVYLDHGSNLIPIVVTAADGITEKTYVLSVNGTVNNADLASLSVDSFEIQPIFSKDIMQYSVAVPNENDKVMIKAITDDPKALAIFNGTVLRADQGQEVDLQVGVNKFDVHVVAQNATIKTYQLTIHRAASSNANLLELSLSESTIKPMFTSEEIDYSSDVPYSVNSVQVLATAVHPNATMTVRVNGGSYEAIHNGQSSLPLDLETGENFIEILVTAEDANVQKRYTIRVTRAKSDNADLSNIILSNGAVLNETFAAANTVYTVNVPYSTTNITVKPISKEPVSSIIVRVNGGSVQTVQSGFDSTPLPLVVGSNTITLVVESEDGSMQKTYTVHVTRKAAVNYGYDGGSGSIIGSGGSGGASSGGLDSSSDSSSDDEGSKGNDSEIDLSSDEEDESSEHDTPSYANQPSEQSSNFIDTVGHWAESNIGDAIKNNIVSGYPDGSFKPNNPVTRAEFTVMLMNALKLEISDGPLDFIDQEKIGHWAQGAVGLAVKAGIVSGFEDGSFRPDALITRVEMAAMIARALGIITDNNIKTEFVDDEEIPHWAKGAVEAIRQLGIVKGRGDNNFVANDTASRAESIVMLLRMLEVINER